jgi:Mn2+/Fe2+ NRAMP family transporter
VKLCADTIPKHTDRSARSNLWSHPGQAGGLPHLFIGISIGLDYLGVSKVWGLVAAAVIIMAVATTGNFRRFERFAMILVFGSLLLVPIVLMIHPPMGQIAHDLVTPAMPVGSKLSDVMLLIIAIVGTTVAPWQLFFQQSYVIDKRITPRFIKYERIDLWLGIVIVIVGAVAMMAFCAETFVGKPEFGNFADAGAVASGIGKYFGRVPGIMFAVALIDASIIGASAVSLSTAYALGDCLALKHSLHRKATDAKGFYAVYCGLIAVAAALVLTPGAPLGLLTNLVQTLAGVLLPSATVFLLLLCNDKDVLGPWVNSRLMNLFAGAIVAVLVMMSIILTASILFPGISEVHIVWILVIGVAVTILSAIGVKWYERARGIGKIAYATLDTTLRDTWRMPPIGELPPAQISLLNRLWMIVLRGYLVVAAGMLIFKMIQLAVGQSTGV